MLMRWESVCVYLIKAVLFWYQGVPRQEYINCPSVQFHSICLPPFRNSIRGPLLRKVRGEVVKMDPQLIVLKEEIRVENSNHRIEFEFMNVF